MDILESVPCGEWEEQLRQGTSGLPAGPSIETQLWYRRRRAQGLYRHLQVLLHDAIHVRV